MRKTFNLETTIGRLKFEVNGACQIYVQTLDEKVNGERCISPVIIRGKEYTGNMHFTLVGNTWEAQCWTSDGNHTKAVDPTSDYDICRAGNLRQRGGWGIGEATSAAKGKFYRVIKEALNTVWGIQQMRAEIRSEMISRDAERLMATFEAAQAKVFKLREELAAAEKELAKLLPA